METLFSCRNCIHNCGQSLTIGPGSGFCLQHNSVIIEPECTTCKYLHRKDLPSFVVEEGTREHAAEFAGFPRLVTLDAKQPIERVPYREKDVWEHKNFDPLLHAVAQYYTVEPRWAWIAAFAGGTDGRRSLTHNSLVRHYMDRCGTWTSSYRLVLGLLRDLAVQPIFNPTDLLAPAGNGAGAPQEALWDVIFVRLGALQEYGWHAGLEALMWASDAVSDGLTALDWPRLQQEFARLRDTWSDLIIEHAKTHAAFFPEPQHDFVGVYEGEA